jgi:hypothetical protein
MKVLGFGLIAAVAFGVAGCALQPGTAEDGRATPSESTNALTLGQQDPGAANGDNGGGGNQPNVEAPSQGDDGEHPTPWPWHGSGNGPVQTNNNGNGSGQSNTGNGGSQGNQQNTQK